MNTKKAILIFLFSLTVILGGVKKHFASNDGEGIQISVSLILFSLSGLAWVIFLLFYMVCPNPMCKSHQIFIGGVFHWTSLSWPGTNCHRCGVDLDTKYKDGRPV